MKKLLIALCMGALLAAPAFADSCSMEKDGEHADCPMNGHEAVETTAVEMTGKVLCMHCNLHKEDSCRKVFQEEGKDTLVDLCPKSDMKAIEAVSEHGDAILVVKGSLAKSEDGKTALVVESVEKAKS